jgi:hypothetical protein
VISGQEMRRLEAKLRVASADIYGDFDRFKAEGELRLNVAPPIVALSLVLALQLSWWCALGVILAVALAWQGAQRLDLGREVVLQALMADVFKVEIEARSPSPARI